MHRRQHGGIIGESNVHSKQLEMGRHQYVQIHKIRQRLACDWSRFMSECQAQVFEEVRTITMQAVFNILTGHRTAVVHPTQQNISQCAVSRLRSIFRIVSSISRSYFTISLGYIESTFNIALALRPQPLEIRISFTPRSALSIEIGHLNYTVRCCERIYKKEIDLKRLSAT